MTRIHIITSMKRLIYSLFTACAALIPLVASAERPIPGDWKVFNTFDYYFKETVDTPDRVYILALGQIIYPGGAMGQSSWSALCP